MPSVLSPLEEVGRIHLLVDPDRWTREELELLFTSLPPILGSIIVGGTYVHGDSFESTMESCIATGRPVGNVLGAGPIDCLVSPAASFVLVPILLGAKVTEFITDHLIRASATLRRYGTLVIPYGYLTLDGGQHTSMSYFTQALPIPRGKAEIVRTLALAARYLGLAGVYLEAGSGAPMPVLADEVAAAAEGSRLPVLVGGGIRSVRECTALFDAGATGIVVGTVIEDRRSLEWLQST